MRNDLRLGLAWFTVAFALSPACQCLNPLNDVDNPACTADPDCSTRGNNFHCCEVFEKGKKYCIPAQCPSSNGGGAGGGAAGGAGGSCAERCLTTPPRSNTCSASGECQCGAGKPACKEGQRCASGACVCDVVSCPKGCCDSSKLCRVDAGSGGVSCVPRPDGGSGGGAGGGGGGGGSLSTGGGGGASGGSGGGGGPVVIPCNAVTCDAGCCDAVGNCVVNMTDAGCLDTTAPAGSQCIVCGLGKMCKLSLSCSSGLSCCN